MPNTIPAMLMARLAIDLTCQGQGLGRSLLVDAIRRTWAVMRNPAQLRYGYSVVDAKDDDARRDSTNLIRHAPVARKPHEASFLSLTRDHWSDVRTPLIPQRVAMPVTAYSRFKYRIECLIPKSRI